MKDQETARAEYDPRRKCWTLWYRSRGSYVYVAGRKAAEAMLPHFVAETRAKLSKFYSEIHAERVRILARQPGQRWNGIGPDMWKFVVGHMRARGLEIEQRCDGLHYLVQR